MFSTIFKFVIKHLSLILGIALILMSLIWIKSCNSSRKELEQNKALISDYEAIMASKTNENRQLQMTCNQISSSKDSIFQLLDAARKDAGIKQKNVKEYVYLRQSIHDTLKTVMSDSIFIQNIDTTVVYNDFTKMNIKIDAPFKLNITPDIASEKILIFNYKKEYVNTPSKLFFVRWFQKKRKVVTVDIKESNPLIKVDQTRFVNIVDD